MKFPSIRNPKIIWAWLFWGLGIYLVIELGTFFIANLALNKTVGELAGPYLAFAAPGAIMLSLIWWLKKWDLGGASPKALARGWGLSMVLLDLTIASAGLYSGVKLGLIDLSDVEIPFIGAILYGGLISYFGMYYLILQRISATASRKLDNTHSK